MDDNKKHIDDIFKDGLYDYKPTPSKNFMTQLKDKLSQNNTFFTTRNTFSLIAIILLLGGSILLYSSYTTNNKKKNLITTRNSEVIIKETNKEKKVEEELRQTISKTNTSSETTTADKIIKSNNTTTPLLKAPSHNTTTNNTSNIFKEKILSNLDNNTIEKESITSLKNINKTNIQSKAIWKKKHMTLRNRNPLNDINLFSKSKINYYIKTGIGIGRTNMNSDSLKNKRNNSFELLIGHEFDNNISIESGISYNQLSNEGYGRWYYTSEEHAGDFSFFVRIPILSEEGDTISYVSSLLKVPYHKTINHSEIEKISQFTNYIQIPAVVGYKFLDIKSIHFKINGGIIFNYLQTQTLSYARRDNQLFTSQISDNKNTFFEFYTSLEISYLEQKRYGIFIEPYFIRSLQPVINNENNRIIEYGIKAGIKIKL